MYLLWWGHCWGWDWGRHSGGFIVLYFIPLGKKDSSVDLENFMYIFIHCKIRIFPRSIARVAKL